ncbi:MAG: hypothetical protein RLZZ481_2433 [Pseudomonadota bacterium]
MPGEIAKSGVPRGINSTEAKEGLAIVDGLREGLVEGTVIARGFVVLNTGGDGLDYELT